MKSFKQALRRFTKGPSLQSTLNSDNFSHFLGINRGLIYWSQGFKQGMVKHQIMMPGIQWHFSPPCASHRGGVIERLTGFVRRIMLSLIEQQALHDESSSTALTLANGLLINRPVVLPRYPAVGSWNPLIFAGYIFRIRSRPIH